MEYLGLSLTSLGSSDRPAPPRPAAGDGSADFAQALAQAADAGAAPSGAPTPTIPAPTVPVPTAPAPTGVAPGVPVPTVAVPVLPVLGGAAPQPPQPDPALGAIPPRVVTAGLTTLILPADIGTDLAAAARPADPRGPEAIVPGAAGRDGAAAAASVPVAPAPPSAPPSARATLSLSGPDFGPAEAGIAGSTPAAAVPEGSAALQRIAAPAGAPLVPQPGALAAIPPRGDARKAPEDPAAPQDDTAGMAPAPGEIAPEFLPTVAATTASGAGAPAIIGGPAPYGVSATAGSVPDSPPANPGRAARPWGAEAPLSAGRGPAAQRGDGAPARDPGAAATRGRSADPAAAAFTLRDPGSAPDGVPPQPGPTRAAAETAAATASARPAPAGPPVVAPAPPQPDQAASPDALPRIGIPDAGAAAARAVPGLAPAAPRRNGTAEATAPETRAPETRLSEFRISESRISEIWVSDRAQRPATAAPPPGATAQPTGAVVVAALGAALASPARSPGTQSASEAAGPGPAAAPPPAAPGSAASVPVPPAPPTATGPVAVTPTARGAAPTAGHAGEAPGIVAATAPQAAAPTRAETPPIDALRRSGMPGPSRMALHQGLIAPDPLPGPGMAPTGVGSPVQAAVATVATAADQGPFARQVADQIVQSVVEQQGRDRIALRLDPPELGRIDMALDLRDQGLRITIGAERAATGDLIRRHADTLIASFAEAGFTGIDLQFSGQGMARRDATPQVAARETAEAPRIPPAQRDAATPIRSAVSTASGIDLRL